MTEYKEFRALLANDTYAASFQSLRQYRSALIKSFDVILGDSPYRDLWEESTPAPKNKGRWTEGICGVGAAILRDGVMVPVEEVIRELNRCSDTLGTE